MNIQIIDNAIDNNLRQEVWDYLKNQTWYVKYKQDSSVESFVPSVDGFDFPNRNEKAIHGTSMARAPLACDGLYLKAKHKPLFKLWSAINAQLGDKYQITGNREGMPHSGSPESMIKTAIEGLEPGWRVYTNGQYQEPIKRSHGIHRDSPDLDDPTQATILYVANLEWFPSWFAEIVYYDSESTGDHQQFQIVDEDAQRRDFNLGWANKIVSPVPGRIICYDGRTLHTTRPAAAWAKEPRITLAFRVKLK